MALSPVLARAQASPRRIRLSDRALYRSMRPIVIGAVIARSTARYPQAKSRCVQRAVPRCNLRRNATGATGYPILNR